MKQHAYTVTRTRRKTLTLQIGRDMSLVVKAPMHLSDREIEGFVCSHDLWIEKRLKKLESVIRGGFRTYTEGEQYLYLGIKRSLRFVNVPVIRVTDGALEVPVGLRFRVRKELKDWYRKQARSVLTNQTEKHAKIMHADYAGIRFSDTSSKWGSCKHDNFLQFNWRLVMAPLLVVRYVVIHELAHTFEKNHSRAFWRIVETYNPSYRQQRKWLKDNGHTLVY